MIQGDEVPGFRLIHYLLRHMAQNSKSVISIAIFIKPYCNKDYYLSSKKGAVMESKMISGQRLNTRDDKYHIIKDMKIMIFSRFKIFN